jgi:ribosomal protein S8
MYNYLLGEFVTRMRVASKMHWKSVKIIKSRLVLEVLSLLYKEGFIRGFFVLKNEDSILVYLKYNRGKPSYYSLYLISKPGKRVYWTLNYMSLYYSANGFSGFYVISTNKGLITSTDCMLNSNTKVSGEVLLKVKI